MAARIFLRLMVSRKVSTFLYRREIVSSLKGFKSQLKTGLILGGIFTGISKDKTPEKRATLEEPDSSKLSREYLIKSAGVSTTEQACTLLTQAALALTEAEKQYTEALFALSVLMEYKLKVLGHSAEEARIWDLIMEGRDLVSFARQKKQTLEIIVTNAKNIVNAGAEIAYMTGEDLVGSTTGDHLNKVEMFLRQSAEECAQAELKLRNIELKTVEVESKYAEEQAEKEKAEKEKVEKEKGEEENSENEKESEKETEQSDKSSSETLGNQEFISGENKSER